MPHSPHQALITLTLPLLRTRSSCTVLPFVFFYSIQPPRLANVLLINLESRSKDTDPLPGRSVRTHNRLFYLFSVRASLTIASRLRRDIWTGRSPTDTSPFCRQMEPDLVRNQQAHHTRPTGSGHWQARLEPTDHLAPLQGMVTIGELMQKLRSTSASAQAAAAYEIVDAIRGKAPISAGRECCFAAAIPVLVHLLESSLEEAVHRAAALALAQLGAEAQYAVMIAEAGGVPALVKLLQCGPAPVQGVAVMALATLVLWDSLTPAASGAAAQAIPSALQMLRCDPDIQHKERAMLFLANLIAFQGDSRTAVAQAADAIPLIVQMLNSSSAALQEQTSRVIGELIFSTHTQSVTAIRDSVLDAGAIPLLVQVLLQPGSEAAELMAVKALSALGWLVEGGTEARERLTCIRMAVAGAIPPLVKLFGSKNTETQKSAMQVLVNLSRNTDCCLRMVAEGAIPPLVQLLEDTSKDSVYIQEGACLALSGIAWKHKDFLSAVIAAGAISPLAHISVFASKPSMQALAARTLASWGGLSLDYRQKIAAAEVQHLSALGRRLNSYSATERERALQGVEARLMQGTTPDLPDQAAGSQYSEGQFLSDVGRAVHSNRQEVKALVVAPLLQVLQSTASAPAVLELQEKAAAALRGLADGSPELGAAILATGALPVLSELMAASSSEAVRQEVGRALRSLETVAASQARGTEAAGLLEAVSLKAGTMSLSASPDASGAAGTAAVRPEAKKRKFSADPTAALGSAGPGESAAGPLPLHVNRKKLCWSCAAEEEHLKKCSGCGAAWYCGIACQKADRMTHKGQCAELKASAAATGLSRR